MLCWLAASGLCGPGIVADGQTAHFIGAQTAVGTGFEQPVGVAVDGSGNLFVVDTDTFTINELIAVNGTITSSPAVRTLLHNTSSNPQYLAVDEHGNVYFTDGDTLNNFQNNSVKEILAVNGVIPPSPTLIQLGNGLWFPEGVAVDKYGNVFVADTDHGLVKEMLAVNGSVPSSPTIVTLGSGFYLPEGIAVDGNGNVYVSDRGNHAVKEILAVNGSIPASPTINTLVSGVCSPAGIALDSLGNIYFANYCGAHQVFKISAVNGSIPPSPTVEPIGNGVAIPLGVAADNLGDVYVAGSDDTRITKISLSDGNFGSVRVGSPSSVLPMVFAFDSFGTLGSVSVRTQGATGLDFADAGTGTCQGGIAYNAGQTCTVNVVFTPKFPGARRGAVLLMDGSGRVIATAYLNGTGIGPQIGFLPGSSSLIASGFNMPEGEAIDGKGNIYFADYNTHSIKEVVAVNGTIPASPTIVTLSSNFTYPIDVAVDGTGNLFVSDWIAGTISEISAGNGSLSSDSPLRTVVRGFSSPMGLAVDGAGNVFVSDYGSNTLNEILAVNGSIPPSPAVRLVASGFIQPTFLTIDKNNNIFISDWGNNAVKEVLAVNGTIPPSPSVITIADGFSNLMSLATDAAGNLFVANAGYNEIDKLLAVNGSLPVSPQIVRLTDALNEPWGLALSGDGNIFVTDTGNNRIVKFDLSDPPNLTFPSTDVGTTSPTQTINVVNSGNFDLSFPVLVSGNNPSIATNFTLDENAPSACSVAGSGFSEPSTLGVDSSCVLSIGFSPTMVGSLSGSLVLTDSNLNAAEPGYATQGIALNGTGTPGAPTITWPTPDAISYGTALNSTQLDATANVQGKFEYMPAAGSILPLGTNALNVVFTPNDTTNYKTSSASQTLLVNPGFVLSSSPSALSITQGKSATIAITVMRGGISKVKLTASGLPSGMAAEFSPDQATNTSSLTLWVGGNTPTGTFPIRINGTSGSLTGSTTVSLTVSPRKS